jgi:hypothetical protein
MPKEKSQVEFNYESTISQGMVAHGYKRLTLSSSGRHDYRDFRLLHEQYLARSQVKDLPSHSSSSSSPCSNDKYFAQFFLQETVENANIPAQSHLTMSWDPTPAGK